MSLTTRGFLCFLLYIHKLLVCVSGKKCTVPLLDWAKVTSLCSIFFAHTTYRLSYCCRAWIDCPCHPVVIRTLITNTRPSFPGLADGGGYCGGGIWRRLGERLLVCFFFILGSSGPNSHLSHSLLVAILLEDGVQIVQSVPNLPGVNETHHEKNKNTHADTDRHIK